MATSKLNASLATFVDTPGADVLLAGLAEHDDGTGWSLTFQGGSPGPEQDTMGEEYCLVNEASDTVYGQIDSVVLDGNVLRLKLGPTAARELDLRPQVEIVLDTGEADINKFRDGLARIFAAIDVERRPRQLVLPGSEPSVEPGTPPWSGKAPA